jgi:hypothetical protein
VLEVNAGSGGLTRILFPLSSGDFAVFTVSDISVVNQYFPAVQSVRYDVNIPWMDTKVNALISSLH